MKLMVRFQKLYNSKGQAVYDPSEWEQTFGAAGGGIRTAGSRPFLENLIIKNNSAHLGGGIYYHGEIYPIRLELNLKMLSLSIINCKRRWNLLSG